MICFNDRSKVILLIVWMMLVAVLYATTLAVTVVQIDSGELAAVQSVLGIAHPTGYPLFTLIGRVFSMIPAGNGKIVLLNLLSLILVLASVFVFFCTNRLLLMRTRAGDKPQVKVHGKPGKAGYTASREGGIKIDSTFLPALAGAGFLAFSRTVWNQSSSVEVYALHLFLVVLMLYFLFRAYQGRSDGTYWYMTLFVLALGFGNHLTTVLAVPIVLFLFFEKYRFSRYSFTRLAGPFILFLVTVILLYLYLPIRASVSPPLNWGNPVNGESLFRHITGKQYQVWMFASSDAVYRNLNVFIRHLPQEFGWPGLVLAAIGFFASFTLLGWKQAALITGFLFTVAYAVNYDIHDLDAYFLLAYCVMGIWITTGIARIASWLNGKKQFLRIALWLAVLGSMGYAAVKNRTVADRGPLTLYGDYTRASLSALPDSAFLLSYQWDYLVSPACYFQLVEHLREDIIIVDKELLRRSWYFDQLENRSSSILDGIQKEKEAFLGALAPFEKGKPYNTAFLENAYRRMIARMIEIHSQRSDVFIGPELVYNEFSKKELYLSQGLSLIPDLFFYRVVRSQDYVPLKTGSALSIPERRDKYADALCSLLIRVWIDRAFYELMHGKNREAAGMVKRIKEQFPWTGLPKQLESLLQ